MVNSSKTRLVSLSIYLHIISGSCSKYFIFEKEAIISNLFPRQESLSDRYDVTHPFELTERV